MVGMGEIAGVLSSLKAAKDIAETMIGLRDAAAFQAKAIDFQSKILDSMSSAIAAQEERAALLEKVRDLEKEVASFEAWDAEKERYELKDAGNGTRAYMLKTQASSAEPPHWICPKCFHDRKISILQPETRFPGTGRYLVCSCCGTEIIVEGARYAPAGTEQPRKRR